MPNGRSLVCLRLEEGHVTPGGHLAMTRRKIVRRGPKQSSRSLTSQSGFSGLSCLPQMPKSEGKYILKTYRPVSVRIASTVSVDIRVGEYFRTRCKGNLELHNKKILLADRRQPKQK